jgi:hypothetical protein
MVAAVWEAEVSEDWSETSRRVGEPLGLRRGLAGRKPGGTGKTVGR